MVCGEMEEEEREMVVVDVEGLAGGFAVYIDCPINTSRAITQHRTQYIICPTSHQATFLCFNIAKIHCIKSYIFYIANSNEISMSKQMDRRLYVCIPWPSSTRAPNPGPLHARKGKGNKNIRG